MLIVLTASPRILNRLNALNRKIRKQITHTIMTQRHEFGSRPKGQEPHKSDAKQPHGRLY